jgi:hypothetical protein
LAVQIPSLNPARTGVRWSLGLSKKSKTLAHREALRSSLSREISRKRKGCSQGENNLTKVKVRSKEEVIQILLSPARLKRLSSPREV